MHQAKLWATQVFELTKMKGNLQHSIDTTELCSTHNHPKTGQASIWTPDRHCASEKQPVKAGHSSVACFEHEIY